MKALLFISLFILFIFSAQAETWIFLGDSLTEGYGVEENEAYPNLLQEMFKKEKPDLQIINAGISGSTSSSGLNRLKWFMQKKPSKVFLALGANDGLRGVAIKSIEKNFDSMIAYLREQKVQVVLIGMMLPPNYGEKYAKDFNKITSELAKKYHLKHFPFLLKDVGGKKELNLPDGIHPNPMGHKKMAQNIYQFIKEQL